MKSLTLFKLMIFFGVLSGIFQPRRAEAFVELNTFYTTESFSTGSASTENRMFIDATLGFAIDNQSQYLVGWEYTMHTVNNQSSTATTAYSSSQMGPRFLWILNRAKTWSLGVAYLLVTKGTYTTTGTSEAWTGTAIKADGGYNFVLSEKSMIGLRLNYSSASYTSKLVGSTTYSTVSNAAVYMYPSIYFIYLF